MPIQRIGIYAGTFNPVHAGHVAFALQSMKAAKLDKLYFLPERRSRHKRGVEHFAHRVAMLKQAVRPYPQFGVLEFDDISFSVRRTLPKLQVMFPDSELVFLFGSDVVPHIPLWAHAEGLFAVSELIIGVRSAHDMEEMQREVESWETKPQEVYVIESHAADVSSSTVREALQKRTQASGVLTSVVRYSNHHWLYVSLG